MPCCRNLLAALALLAAVAPAAASAQRMSVLTLGPGEALDGPDGWSIFRTEGFCLAVGSPPEAGRAWPRPIFGRMRTRDGGIIGAMGDPATNDAENLIENTVAMFFSIDSSGTVEAPVKAVLFGMGDPMGLIPVIVLNDKDYTTIDTALRRGNALRLKLVSTPESGEAATLIEESFSLSGSTKASNALAACLDG